MFLSAFCKTYFYALSTYWLLFDFFKITFSDELDISYARSSGPGGQNVNKGNFQLIMMLDCNGFRDLIS